MSVVIRKTSWEDYLDPSGGAYVKCLIMGGHGAGKTRSASFWPKPIFADCESGRMSIADRSVPYVDVRSTADMDGLLEHLRKDGLRAPDKREFGTVVIDTFDAYQRVVISERLRAEKKESLSGWADWGYLDGKMTQLIEKLLNLPINIVVNLHTKDVSDSSDDGEDSILVKKARLKGDIKDTIFQDFDLIGQMEASYVAEKGQRSLQRQIRWHPEPRFPNIRDRSGKLPRFTDVDFTERDYWRIFEALTGDIDSLPDPVAPVEIASGPTDAEIAPAEADVKGGPVEVNPEDTKVKGARKAPAKKAAAKPDPKPAPVVIEEVDTSAKPEPESEPEPEPAPDQSSTDVQDSPEPEVTDEEAEARVAEVLGGEVISAPGARNEGECGFVPESHRHHEGQPAGCGKSLAGENRAKVNLSLLRAKASLCESCFDAWRSADAA